MPTYLPSIRDLVGRSGLAPATLIDDAMPSLSTRVSGALSRDNINTVGDLLARTEADLLDIRNFGSGCLDDIKQALIRANPAILTLENFQPLRALLEGSLQAYTRFDPCEAALLVCAGSGQPPVHVSLEGPLSRPEYVIAAAPTPGDDGPPRRTHDLEQAAAWILAQAGYPYPCRTDCGAPAGECCAPGCQSWPEDRWRPLRVPEQDPVDVEHERGPFAEDEPGAAGFSAASDPWAAAGD